MPLPPFDYLVPKSLEEASALLAKHGDAARIMAGGTDLLLAIGRRVRSPRYVVGLRGIAGLDYVRFDAATGLAIGPMASLATVAQHPDVARLYPALQEAAAAAATVQIRNMGTVAGNICNASPSADTATPLLVHGAEVALLRQGAERVLPLERFFRGPGQTALDGADLVREIRVPAPAPRTGSDYQRLSQRSRVDIAAVCVSVLVALDDAGRCSRVRLALGAVAPTPLRVPDAERSLEGETPTPERLARVAAVAMEAAKPISDIRASAAYRKRLVEVLTRRALDAAVRRAGGGNR